jgi:hypothetical protein
MSAMSGASVDQVVSRRADALHGGGWRAFACGCQARRSPTPAVVDVDASAKIIGDAILQSASLTVSCAS